MRPIAISGQLSSSQAIPTIAQAASASSSYVACSRRPTCHIDFAACPLKQIIPVRFQAKDLSAGESGNQYFQVSFNSEAPTDDDFDLSGSDQPYLVVRRQFEDDDGDVCYIETHDHDTYTGHFHLRLIEFIPSRARLRDR